MWKRHYQEPNQPSFPLVFKHKFVSLSSQTLSHNLNHSFADQLLYFHGFPHRCSLRIPRHQVGRVKGGAGRGGGGGMYKFFFFFFFFFFFLHTASFLGPYIYATTRNTLKCDVQVVSCGPATLYNMPCGWIGWLVDTFVTCFHCRALALLTLPNSLRLYSHYPALFKKNLGVINNSF